MVCKITSVTTLTKQWCSNFSLSAIVNFIVLSFSFTVDMIYDQLLPMQSLLLFANVCRSVHSISIEIGSRAYLSFSIQTGILNITAVCLHTTTKQFRSRNGKWYRKITRNEWRRYTLDGEGRYFGRSRTRRGTKNRKTKKIKKRLTD